MQENRDVVDQIDHQPFRLRTRIALSGLFSAVSSFFLILVYGRSLFDFFGVSAPSNFSQILCVCFFVYAGVVSALEGLVTFFLKKRPSQDANPTKLLEEEKVTPEEFDVYYRTRSIIRCASFLSALLGGFLISNVVVMSFFNVFFLVYVLTTLFGSLWVRYTGIKRPKIFVSRPHTTTSCDFGHQSMAENCMNRSLNESVSGSDFGPYYVGMIKF